jgi:hypothetical protein
MRELNGLSRYNLITMNDGFDILPTVTGSIMAKFCIGFNTMVAFTGVSILGKSSKGTRQLRYFMMIKSVRGPNLEKCTVRPLFNAKSLKKLKKSWQFSSLYISAKVARTWHRDSANYVDQKYPWALFPEGRVRPLFRTKFPLFIAIVGKSSKGSSASHDFTFSHKSLKFCRQLRYFMMIKSVRGPNL